MATVSPRAHPPRRRLDRAVGRSPAEHQQLGALVGVDLQLAAISSAILASFSARSRVISAWFSGS